MKDTIVNLLAIYGGYSLVNNYWQKNKNRIIKSAVTHISEAIKEAMADEENPVTINIVLGGGK
jgi:hypothetical protein